MTNGVTQVVLCTGKVYDLLQATHARTESRGAGARRAALPVPARRFRCHRRTLSERRLFVWCQEEPQNQGAWDQINTASASCRTAGAS